MRACETGQKVSFAKEKHWVRCQRDFTVSRKTLYALLLCVERYALHFSLMLRLLYYRFHLLRFALQMTFFIHLE